MTSPQKAALLSVSNRDGLVGFAKFLAEKGYALLTTSGTGRVLQEAGIECVSIESYTGQKEILGGRVKTLHPKIHAGLLSRRDNPEDMKVLEEEGIFSIEVAAVNLYPFEQHLQSDSVHDFQNMIEQIDIGGPTMIRAAAKNHRHVFPVLDPKDYGAVQAVLENEEKAFGAEGQKLRLRLALDVFAALAQYNLQIAKYLSYVALDDKSQYQIDTSNDFALGEYSGSILKRSQSLRYGENPHQKAGFYLPLDCHDAGWKQHQGKELSYNNLLDFDAALQMIISLPRERAGCVIVKHLNPCGVAIRENLLAALSDAKKGDPRSHFGGILAFNQKVSEDEARGVTADFAEIVLAPEYAPEALDVFKKKKNLRVLEIDFNQASRLSSRSVGEGVLIQEQDISVSTVLEANVVSERKPTDQEFKDLQLAWTMCAHVKSNAITLAKNEMLLASGAGQMSRIDSVEVALQKCDIHEHNLQGAVAASDAFFPFPDSVETLAKRGVSAIVSPAGAKKDSDVIAAANAAGIALVFVEDRHFRH